MRFELIHRNRHYPLKVACLPIPPLAQNVSSFMRSPSKLSPCPRQDSNLHVAKHSHLKRARLPIPPLGLLCYSLLLALGPNEKSRTQSTSILFFTLAPYFAVRTGLEPATPCVTGRYSNQLNYRTKTRSVLRPSLSRAVEQPLPFSFSALSTRKRQQRYCFFLVVQ